MVSTYNNEVLTCTPIGTPDPYVTESGGKWYMTFTAADHVEIWRSDTVFDFSRASRHEVWRPPPGTPYSADIWAPELHVLGDRWYIYVACAHPAGGNASHRMYVLGGPPRHVDPTTPQWEFLGPLQMPRDQWAIDGTVVPLAGGHYFVYSGWPLGETANESVQQLFIVRLVSPVAADPGAGPTSICQPDQPWERSGNSAINEGPQFLASPDGSWVGIVYSCAGSWSPDYKMNTLRYLGGDPMNAASWRKGTQPLLVSRPDGVGPYGPGHGSFVTIGHGQTLAVFHATDSPTDGWENRKARCQLVMWTADGPHMGGFVGPLRGGEGGVMPGPSAGGGHGRLEDRLSRVLDKAEQVIRRLC